MCIYRLTFFPGLKLISRLIFYVCTRGCAILCFKRGREGGVSKEIWVFGGTRKGRRDSRNLSSSGNLAVACRWLEGFISVQLKGAHGGWNSELYVASVRRMDQEKAGTVRAPVSILSVLARSKIGEELVREKRVTSEGQVLWEH